MKLASDVSKLLAKKVFGEGIGKGGGGGGGAERGVQVGGGGEAAVDVVNEKGTARHTHTDQSAAWTFHEVDCLYFLFNEIMEKC